MPNRLLPGKACSAFLAIAALMASFAVSPVAFAADHRPSGFSNGLLFSLSGGRGLSANFAKGSPLPNFAANASPARDASGPYLKIDDGVVLSWLASKNIYAERGTLAFRWRARTPLGAQPFALFRVGYADHTSWDMVWLRIDWNGHGFDAFVTDNNLARVRVSWRMDEIPPPDRWTDIAFSWDETVGVRLYVDGKLVAHKDQPAALDAGLDQFGPCARIISPHQVQSNFQFMRGVDMKDIAIFDRMLNDNAIESVSRGAPSVAVSPARMPADARRRHAWLSRYGWDTQMPRYLSDPATTIRKVEFADAVDVRERMTAGNDGIDETTWPGVYNRSKLPGRHDYFELPDWNVYAEGGKAVTFTLPDETFNHVEFLGAAYGRLTYRAGADAQLLASRPAGRERTGYDFAARRGGHLRFENLVQETPIREIGAYYIHAGAAPAERTLSYRVRAAADPADYPSTDEVRAYVSGRYPADEATLAVALPDGAPSVARPQPAGSQGARLPVVHIVVPGDMRQRMEGKPNRYSYGWTSMRQGLDGIEIEIPALKVRPLRHGYYPLNIRVKDPIWPGRNLLDVNVSVKPGEARTVWLDTRDRFLPDGGSLYLTLAGGGAGLDARLLDGMAVRLKFKPRAAARAEHVADRLAQIRDEAAFLVEEYTGDARLARAERLNREFASLFAVDPDNVLARQYYAVFHADQPWPKLPPLASAPKGVPAWAWLQARDLEYVHRFVGWWIDRRQSAYGDFGGGISDDDDLTHQWPPLALMGVEPEKIRVSLSALCDAVDKNGMITNGLGTIETDYLHTYEEGINARSDDLYLNWGSPRVLERLMETARAYPRIVKKDAAGRAHIISQLYSGTHVVREGRWGWAHPYSYLILHPAIMLAEYNRNPQMVALIRDLADGYLAAAKTRADGTPELPEMINGNTGETSGRLTVGTRGIAGPMQLFWAAYKLTGDETYFSVLKGLIDENPVLGLRLINADLAAHGAPGAAWQTELAARAKAAQASTEVLRFAPARGDGSTLENYERFYAWRESGNPRWLQNLYADEIATARQQMYMLTEGQWWSDRVEIFSDLLQRARLGGLAVRRNQEVPGHLVGWTFGKPGDAEKIGILIRNPRPDSFTVEAYNFSGRPISAKMTGWQVAPGRWQMTGGTGASRSFVFETSRSVDLSFPSGRTVKMSFRRTEASPSPSLRPDLGIGPDDVRVRKDKISVTVHSLGSQDMPASRLELLDASGKVLAQVPVPPLKAPNDNLPKTATVTLRRKGGGVAVRVGRDGVEEITAANNRVTLLH